MTTARDVCIDAAYASTALGQGETLSANDSQLILRRFGRLLDSWANENLLIYNIYIDQLTLTSNVLDYSTTLLSQGRPVSVDSMYVRQSQIDYWIEMVDNQKYGEIPLKEGVSSIPAYCWYDSGFPDGTFHFWPAPYSPMTAFVNCRRVLRPANMTLDSVLSFPPGYERMFVDQLGLDICPSFGVQPSPALVASARESKATLKRANHVPLESDIDIGDWSPAPYYPLFKGF